MATSMKKTTTSKPKVEETSTKRVFEPNDLIPCKSITAGELLMEGYKTKFVYKSILN